MSLLDELSQIAEIEIKQSSALQNLFSWHDISDFPSAYQIMVLDAFGVLPDAKAFILSHANFEIGSLPGYGGGFYPPSDLSSRGRIVMPKYQAEGTLHESSHVWYHWWRQSNPTMVLELCRMVVEVSENTDPRFSTTREFLSVYVNGNPGWAGMYPGIIDKHNIQTSDINITLPLPASPKIIDWEIFAGLCSFTMGKFKTGKHALPENLWRFFDPMLSGNIICKTYYD